MKKNFLLIQCFFTVCLVLSAIQVCAEQKFENGNIYVWVEKEYQTRENPLPCEFSINGQLVNIYQTDTYENIDKYLQVGWNSITLKTTPQETANNKNKLIFHIGPMIKSPKNPNKYIMYPQLWKFSNGADWKYRDGKFSHPLGPQTKEVSLTYNLYLSDNVLERSFKEIKEGDYILTIAPEYSTKDTPVIASIAVNGTAFSSFTLSSRNIIITDLLKNGKNVVKIASHRVDNLFQKNDIECSIQGPAHWSPGQNRFLFKPVTDFSAIQGWIKDKETGKLQKAGDPQVSWIERTIPFVVKDVQEDEEPKAEKPVQAQPNMLETKNI